MLTIITVFGSKESAIFFFFFNFHYGECSPPLITPAQQNSNMLNYTCCPISHGNGKSNTSDRNCQMSRSLTMIWFRFRYSNYLIKVAIFWNIALCCPYMNQRSTKCNSYTDCTVLYPRRWQL
jgi:hypothetical protein